MRSGALTLVLAIITLAANASHRIDTPVLEAVSCLKNTNGSTSATNEDYNNDNEEERNTQHGRYWRLIRSACIFFHSLET